ncbi:phosphate ABC transporter permease subunit PstC [Thermophilibacter provencensis]|uniref:Phosphate transport system permease protein n=1 Tax=Thermophilibacter provencensis TaxID=1852386 RepID=A0ABT7V3J0_9ACTN|nr:phosphate ABC transporter permease subunit PstC [Thermophilibacter provencensis]MDM8271165.1 phosphate ABC transporter permease subunit PstC [Thermophilibacter provencensis]
MANLMPKRRLENIGLGITGFCVALVALVVITLIFMVAQQGLTTFFVDGLNPIDFFFGQNWIPEQERYGALPMIVGSFAVTLLSTLFALPIAIGSAIFVVEVAPSFGRRVFQPFIELLVGIPSVVYGVLGLYVVNTFVKAIFGDAAPTGAGILSGSIVLAIMILPTITTLSMDALRAVPNQYREGSYALGCTRWQTVWHVVLKSALPSLMTAVILGMTRAFGETLAVQMVIGGVERSMPMGLLDPASTLTAALTAGLSNAVSGSVYYHALWSLGLILLVMSLVFIMIIHLIGRKGAKANG